MKIEQRKFSKSDGWETLRSSGIPALQYNIVFAFGSTGLLEQESIYQEIKSNYPAAEIVMSSTSGEIIDTQVNDDSISLTAIQFEKTILKTATITIKEDGSSFKAGYRLAEKFYPEGLNNILVIADGQKVNGSELVLGLQEFLPKNTIITGGLAGDGARFMKTLVGLNESPQEGKIVAIGFYGDSLDVTYGSVGGWDPFGVERLITKSEGNKLYELDGKPALDIYKMYLGEYAQELPGSGLLFPLNIRVNSDTPIVRTILAVNDDEKSLTFAGNVPRGAYAQMMKANFDRLIEGASTAAQHSLKDNAQSPDLALLISCVGRKIILNQRIEEEVEVVRTVYGDGTAIAGFYSYGEISPSFNSMKCELHNQTMTITSFTER